MPILEAGAIGYTPGVVTQDPEPPTDRASAAAGGRAFIPFLPPDESGALVDLNLEFGTVTNDGRNTHNYDTPANVNDGNEGNPPAFANSGVDDNVFRGLESDLGSAREVHKMRIRADRSGTTAQADYVESSPDGSSWSAVAGSWASSGSDRIFTFAAPETERYFAAGFLDTPFAFFAWIDWFTWTIEGPQDSPPESVLWIDAPLTIDGSSSTYEEVFEDTVAATTGPFWRGTLDDTYLIARFAAEIGFENAGSVTVLVQAGNEADYSDATTITTITLTATGSFTADDLATSWVPTAVFRYWQLVLDTTAQGVQVIEVHLFDPLSGSGAVDEHITDPTDAHDASAVSVADAAGFFEGDDVEAVLAELGAGVRGYLTHDATDADPISFATGHHRVDLDDDFTVVFDDAVSGDSYWTIVDYVGDGTPRTVDYSGSSVTWVGDALDHPGTLNAVVTVIYRTTDGGATVVAQVAGGGGSAITVEDEGTPLATAADTLDFVGAGVTASGSGAEKTITIPGGATASDTSIWRPLINPATGDVITDATTGEAIMGFGPA